MTAFESEDHAMPPGGPAIAHEIRGVRIVADEATEGERLLELVDRVLVLENKLAEARHRYRLRTMPIEYPGTNVPEPVAPRARFQVARDVYTRILTIPVVGGVARRAVRFAKKVRAGRAS